MKKTLNFHFANYSLEDIGEITMCGNSRVMLYEDVLDNMVDYDELIARVLFLGEKHVHFDMSEHDEPGNFKKFIPDMIGFIKINQMIFDPEFFMTDDGFSVTFDGPEQYKLNSLKRMIRVFLTE